MSPLQTMQNNAGKPLVMGILNCTPDSFFAGSRKQTEREIAVRAARILEEGGDIIDVGAYSTRPGAAEVTLEEEMRRMRRALETVRHEVPDATLSIDTFRPEVARMAVEGYGAQIINDVSEGLHLEEMAAIGVTYVLMSVQPDMPSTLRCFREKVARLRGLGCDNIILDPGFGFGKEVTVKMDCYQSGNNCDCNPAMATFAGFKVALGKNRLFELWNSNDFALDQSDVKGIDIDGIYTNTPSKDVENKIKKNLFPYLSNNGTGFGFEVYASGSRYGNFKNGRITSNVYQEQQQEAAQNMRKIQKEYDEGCKKYGKQNYDAFLKGKVIVGMPEELILRYNNELAQQVGPRKMYRLYDGNMWHPKVVYTVWVVNGKVSSFRYYR